MNHLGVWRNEQACRRVRRLGRAVRRDAESIPRCGEKSEPECDRGPRRFFCGAAGSTCRVQRHNLVVLGRQRRYDQYEQWGEYIRALDQLDLEFALHFHLVRSPESLHDRSGLMRPGIFGPRELPAYEVFGRINNPGAAWD